MATPQKTIGTTIGSRPGGTEAGGFVNPATIDHGSLAGLGDDDHTQYLRVNGARNSTGYQRFEDTVATDFIAEHTVGAGVEIDSLLVKDGSARPNVNVNPGTGAISLNVPIETVAGGGGGVTRTLPTAVGNRGLTFIVKKNDAAAGTITIDTTGGQTIDGATTYVLTVQYESVTLISDGTNWMVV